MTWVIRLNKIAAFVLSFLIVGWLVAVWFATPSPESVLAICFMWLSVGFSLWALVKDDAYHKYGEIGLTPRLLVAIFAPFIYVSAIVTVIWRKVTG